MKKIFPQPDEFYVGYLPEAPPATASFIRRIIIAMGSLIFIIAIVLATHQKKFSANNFEFGINTTLQGYVFTDKVPRLLVPMGKDIRGKELYQTFLLVGFGKFGASETLSQLASATGTFLHGRFVTLTGSLIYGDGKALLQITPEDNPVDQLLKQDRQGGSGGTVPQIHDNGRSALDGEIVDAKCFFGVMKPGQGKPHRSCAIRCISGGVPAVLAVKGGENKSSYFLVLDESYKMINQELLPIVGQPVHLQGQVITLADWHILLVNHQEIQQLAVNAPHQAENLALLMGITSCHHER